MAFNFLIAEICQAIGAGLEAENEEMVQHWGQAFSRSYVTKLVRNLKDGEIFRQNWRTIPDPETGKKRRRSTFNLNHEHALVQAALTSPSPDDDDSMAEPATELEPAAVATATWDADPQPAETLDLADLNLDPALLEDATQEEVQAESEDPSSPLGRFMRFLTRP